MIITYLAERGVPTQPQELAGHDWISFTMLSPLDFWRFAGPKPQQRVIVNPRLIVNTGGGRAAKAGLGITRVLSYQVAGPLADGSLRLILEDFEPEAMPVSLLHREDRLRKPKCKDSFRRHVRSLGRAVVAPNIGTMRR